MTTSDQDQKEHEGPGPRRPLDELTADELLAVAEAEARAGELSDLARTTRTVYLGACLLAIRDRGLYAAQGEATFNDFAAALNLEKDRCARLLKAGQVPLALVKDRNIAECKLAAIGNAPAWLWPALCAEVTPSVGMRTLRRAVSVAKAEVAQGVGELLEPGAQVLDGGALVALVGGLAAALAVAGGEVDVARGAGHLEQPLLHVLVEAAELALGLLELPLQFGKTGLGLLHSPTQLFQFTGVLLGSLELGTQRFVATLVWCFLRTRPSLLEVPLHLGEAFLGLLHLRTQFYQLVGVFFGSL